MEIDEKAGKSTLNAALLSRMTTDELKKLLKQAQNYPARYNAQDVADITAMLANAERGSKTVSSSWIDHACLSNHIVRRVEAGNDGIHRSFFYAPKNKELVQVGPPVDLCMGKIDVNPAVEKLLGERKISVVHDESAGFEQACRLIASYLSTENGIWYSNMGNGATVFNNKALPVIMPSSAGRIKYNTKLSGVQLYRELILETNPDNKIEIIRAAQAIVKPEPRSKDIKDQICKEATLKDGTKILVQARSCDMVEPLLMKVEKTEPHNSMTRVEQATFQKIGGANFVSVNSGYIDGLQLYAPFQAYKELLVCLSNASKFDRVGPKGKDFDGEVVGFETKDSELYQAIINLYQRDYHRLKDKPKGFKLHIIGPDRSPKMDPAPSIQVVFSAERNASYTYAYVISPDHIQTPSLKKDDTKNHHVFSAIMDQFAKYGERTHKVWVMCPYVESEFVSRINFHDPVKLHFLSIYLPPKLNLHFGKGKDMPKIAHEEIYECKKQGINCLVQYPLAHRPFITLMDKLPSVIRDMFAYEMEPFFHQRKMYQQSEGGSLEVYMPGIGVIDKSNYSIEDERQLEKIARESGKARPPKKRGKKEYVKKETAKESPPQKEQQPGTISLDDLVG